MKIVVIEPFYISSHKQWLDEFKKHSFFEITLLTLPGRHWKWRMHGAAVTLAKEYLKLGFKPDLILATDMLDFSTFLALTSTKTAGIKTAIYFHENQICYPWSNNDEDVKLKRDVHYGFINYSSALVADKVIFNSNYHKNAFLQTLPSFLNAFPDYQNLESVATIENKSTVLPIGIDTTALNKYKCDERFELPTVLWNHRWEYDKNPDDFFDALLRLKQDGIKFSLVVLGERYQDSPAIFNCISELFASELLHIGYAKDKASYIEWLWKCDILPVTSNQDFFGISTVEATYCNNYPILPNRLAFPEHVPEEHLYNFKEELYTMLKKAITNINKVRSNNFSAFVEKYRWERNIQIYADLLTEI